jgi:hypothetical protein
MQVLPIPSSESAEPVPADAEKGISTCTVLKGHAAFKAYLDSNRKGTTWAEPHGCWRHSCLGGSWMFIPRSLARFHQKQSGLLWPTSECQA